MAKAEKTDKPVKEKLSKHGKKLGAPQLPDEEKLTDRFMIQMTENDKKKYEAYARARKMKLAVFFRTAADEYIWRNPP